MNISRSCCWLPLVVLAPLAACDGNGGTDPGPTTGAVAGSVSAEGAGVEGAAVQLTPGGSLSTSASGQYRFEDLQPGSYEVAVTPPSGFLLAEGEVASKSATVTAGSTTNVSWSLRGEHTNGAEVVEIHLTTGNRFSPENVTISAGSTVRWINDSNMLHTVTPDDADQAGVWAAASTNSQGVVLEHTFTVEGETYDYHCEPHIGEGMVGQITVQ